MFANGNKKFELSKARQEIYKTTFMGFGKLNFNIHVDTISILSLSLQL